jgi:hypothetical protein
MNSAREVNYYAVKADLSLLKGRSQEDCIRQEGFIYGITTTTKRDYLNPATATFLENTTDIQLFDNEKAPFMLSENGWKAIRLNVKRQPEGGRYARVLPVMEIVDPFGRMQEVVADVEYEEGIVQLHRLFRYLSKCPDWDIANERRNKMELKKIFMKLKNGGNIDITLIKNPDEDYSISLSFEHNIFVMRSCVIEGDEYINAIYKEEEELRSDDYYHFMHMVHEKFPKIDSLLRSRL